MFYITPLEASCTTVLGHNWLTHYNPLIDWVLGSIKFHPLVQTDSLMSPETVAMALLSSNPPSPLILTPLVAPKISFVNKAAFACLSKMDNNQVYQLFLSDNTAPNNAPVNILEFCQSTMNVLTSSVKPMPLLPLWIGLMILRLNLSQEPLLHLVQYTVGNKTIWMFGSF